MTEGKQGENLEGQQDNPEAGTETLTEVPKEDLQAQIEVLQQESQQKDATIAERDAALLRERQTVTKHTGTIEQLKGKRPSQGLEGMVKDNAAMLKDIWRELHPEDVTTPSSFQEARRLEREQEEHETATKKTGGVIDPDTRKVQAYIELHDLNEDSPVVQEAMLKSLDAKQALAFFKEKEAEQAKTGIQKQIDEAAKALSEQELKQRGYTAPGPRGPSGPAESWRDLSPEQKILQAVSGK